MGDVRSCRADAPRVADWLGVDRDLDGFFHGHKALNRHGAFFGVWVLICDDKILMIIIFFLPPTRPSSTTFLVS